MCAWFKMSSVKTGLSTVCDFHGFCPGFQCVGGGLSDFNFMGGLTAGCTFGLSLLPLDRDLGLDLLSDLPLDLDLEYDLDLLLLS